VHKTEYGERSRCVRRRPGKGPTQVPGHARDHPNTKRGVPNPLPLHRFCQTVQGHWKIQNLPAAQRYLQVSPNFYFRTLLTVLSTIFFLKPVFRQFSTLLNSYFFGYRDILAPYPASEWQLGTSKVFLKQSVYEPLEQARLAVLNARAVIIQSFIRACSVRKSYLRRKAAVVRVQRYYRTYKQRLEFLRKRRAAITIQTYLRGMFAREVAAALREMRRVEVVVQEESSKVHGEGEEEEEFIHLIQMLQEGGKGAGQQVIMSPASSVVAGSSGVFPSEDDDETTDVGGGATSTEVEEDDDEDDEEEEITSAAAMAANTASRILSSAPSPPPLIPPPGHTNLVGGGVEKKATTTLPEPTVPPPPPPPQQVHHQQVKKVSEQVSQQQHKAPIVAVPKAIQQQNNKRIIPDSSQPKKKSTNVDDEPIYESIQPKIDPKLFPHRQLTQQGQGATTTSTTGPPQVPPTPPPGSGGQAPAVAPDPRSTFIRHRLEALKHDEETQPAPPPAEETSLLSFALDYFNDWEKPSGTLVSLSKPKPVYYSKEEMTLHTRSTSIPSSHIHLFDPSNVKLAVQHFHEIQKYVRGECKQETQFLQALIRNGLDREELRDELYVILIRLINGNDSASEVRRLYFILCLMVGSFPPSKTFLRYFLAFLSRNHEDCGVSDQVNYIKTSLKRSGAGSVRAFPPSSVEIQATQRLGTLVCRVFFADGRSKAVDVHPADTASDVIAKLAMEINLSNVDTTYALYESNRDVDVHVNMHTLLYDVIAKWEIR